MILLPDFQIGILLARRARYLSTSLWLLLATIALSLMAAQFSGRQPATVALDVGLSAIRLLLPVLVVLLTQELLSKEVEQRYILASVTYPRPRHYLLLGRIGSILFLILSLMLIMAISLATATLQISHSYEQNTLVDLGLNFWINMGFIFVDLIVLTAMAAFLSVVASTPSFVLIGTLGFMLIARSYSSIISLLERNRFVVDNADFYKESLGVLHYILPDLGALDVRMISLYGKIELLSEDWAVSISTSLAYAVFLFALAIYFFNQKKFH